MNRNIIWQIGLTVVLATSIIIGAGCGGGGSGGGSSGNPNVPNPQTKFKITGNLDGSTATFASLNRMNFLDRFCSIFSPLPAYAGSNIVTNIIAVCSDMTIIQATHTANDFQLELPLNKAYIVVFLDGTSIIGLYKVDAPTDLDAVPVPETASDLDIGAVGYDALSDTFTAAITQTLLFNALSITNTVATAFGVVDNGMSRLSSLDVDGNTQLDAFENPRKFYDLKIQYMFDETEGFASIQDSFGITSSAVFDWYMYIGYISPEDLTIDWSTSYLNFPSTINGMNCITQTASASYSTYHNLNFSDGFNSPLTPPSGTYTITGTITGTATIQTYTFHNFRSQAIDPNLYNIYIPLVRLNMVEKYARRLGPAH
jgi:hypothetical protein